MDTATPSVTGVRRGANGVHRRREVYPVRVMVGVAVILAAALVLVRLPLYPYSQAVGWRVAPRTQPDPLQLEQMRAEMLARAAPATPPSKFIIRNETGEKGQGDGRAAAERHSTAPAPGTRTEQATAEARQNPTKLNARAAVLEFAEEMPDIVGGLGAYYIHIEYPEAAARAGIQGRLILDFVVETTGWPSQIRVSQSLHPLCDSAAVRALRQTRFVPGKHNGERVRVRMRLPVRFELIDNPAAPDLLETLGDTPKEP